MAWTLPVPPPADAGAFDPAEAGRARALLADPAGWVNLRGIVPGLGMARNVILPAADVDGLLRHAREWAAGGRNVYLTLNPVAPGTDRGPNKGAVIESITSYRWLFVDIDPVRAEGHEKAPATDLEKLSAHAAAVFLRGHLRRCGWPGCVLADSGNGYYLLYRIDLPNTEEAKALVKGVLEALARLCPEGAKVDAQCHDQARIAKLPGTLARKDAPHTAERPYRMSRLLDVPEPLEIVSDAELWELAGVQAEDPAPPPVTNGQATAGTSFVLPVPSGPPVQARAAAYLDSCPEAVSGAGGHKVTFFAARALVWGFCLPEGEALQMLLERYNPRCRPPWSEKELRHKVEEARSKPFNKEWGWLLNEERPAYRAADFAPGGAAGKAPPVRPVPESPRAGRYLPLPPWQPFPVEALPPAVADLVRAGARAVCCDPSMVALPALSTLAAAVGLSRAVILKPGWTEPACVWALVAAGSGTGKTPAWKLATAPLHQLQIQARHEHDVAVRQYEEDLAAHEALGKAERAGAIRPEEPAPARRYVTSDVTVEALGVLLDRAPRGLLVARDELNGWFQGFVRYKGKNGGNDRAQWLELAQAGLLSVDRIGRPSLIVPAALVSVCGGIQRGLLSQVMDREAVTAGLFARLLMAAPPRVLKCWESGGVSPESRADYAALVSALASLPWPGQDTREPVVVGMTREAQALWAEHYDRWAQLQYEADEERAATLAKLEGYAPRLALLDHLCRAVCAGTPDDDPVGTESLRAGIALAEWFAYEADRIAVMASQSAEDGSVGALVEWVQARGGAVTARQVQRGLRRRYPSSADAEAALEHLAALQLGRWEAVPAGRQGGRPTRRFVLDEEAFGIGENEGADSADS